MQLQDAGIIIKIKGASLKISYFFLIFIVISLFSPYAKEFYALILALTVHELSHIIAVNTLMLRVNEIIFLPIGGKIKLEKIKNISYQEEVILSIAGPFGNFICFLFFFALKEKLLLWGEFFNLFASKQISIALFNLLPAYPLDGGRIFLMWLFQNINFEKSINIAVILSIIISLFFIIFGVILFFYRIFSPFYFVFGIFLLFEAIKVKKEMPFRIIFDFFNIKTKINTIGFSKAKCVAVLEDFPLKDVIKIADPKNYIIFVVIDNQGKIKKFLTESEIFDNIIKKGLDLKIGQI